MCVRRSAPSFHDLADNARKLGLDKFETGDVTLDDLAKNAACQMSKTQLLNGVVNALKSVDKLRGGGHVGYVGDKLDDDRVAASRTIATYRLFGKPCRPCRGVLNLSTSHISCRKLGKLALELPENLFHDKAHNPDLPYA